MKHDAETFVQPIQPTKKKHGVLKGFLYALFFLFILAFVVGIAVFFYAQFTKTHYEVTFYQDYSKKVSTNIRLAVISDLHNREYGENNQTLISDLQALDPDLILFPGDMVIREEDNYQPMLDLVSNLTKVAPCYGVLGNHESERIYYGDDKDLQQKFKAAGLKILRNNQEIIQLGEDSIQLIGIEGTAHGFEEYGGREFMDKTTIDPSMYCIVMAHIPILFDSQLSDYQFDLGIAGHTHGGIIKLPFFGGLYSDEEGFFPKYSYGEYILRKSQLLIISGGLGDSKPLPPRINNIPELVVIDIKRY